MFDALARGCTSRDVRLPEPCYAILDRMTVAWGAPPAQSFQIKRSKIQKELCPNLSSVVPSSVALANL